MKRADSTPLRLLLLPLVPALGLGIVEVASRVSMPANVAAVDEAPAPAPSPQPCEGCVMTA